MFLGYLPGSIFIKLMISKFTDIPPQVRFFPQAHMYFAAPCKALKSYISKYTITFSNSRPAADNLTLFPDASGCMIFTYDGSSLNSLLWGTTTKTFVVKNDLNHYPMQLFIELLPGGLFFLTGLKQNELTNLRIPLQQIDCKLHSIISDAFESSKNLGSLIERLDTILLCHIQGRAIPNAIVSALESIKHSNGCLSVKELAMMEAYSDRHLNRLFNGYIGTSVKTFSNIIRINHLLQRLNAGNCMLTDIAQNSGFYDQAHFIHTFKAICGVTPRQYFENMSGFYNAPCSV